MIIFTIFYIKFFITLTTHIFFHFLTSKFTLIQYYKEVFIFCYTSTFIMLIYLLINPLFMNSSLFLNLLCSIVNFIFRILNEIYIVYRHIAESSNRITFFLLIRIFNQYKTFNLSVYNYIFTIELKFFDVLIVQR